MSKRHNRDSVWLAMNLGVEHGHCEGVYGDRDSAFRWLRAKHQNAQHDAARTDEYLRRDYADRAAEETDPEMLEHYEEMMKAPRVRRVSEISESESHGSFNDGEWDRFTISKYEVKTFAPLEATDD